MKNLCRYPGVIRFAASAFFYIQVITGTAQIQLAHTDVSCPDASDGTAEVISVNNGTMPFTYLWSNGKTDQKIFDLPENTYTVRVTDGNNCSGEATVVVSLSLKTLPLTLSQTPEKCDGTKDGSASVSSVTKGVPPFTYLWSNSETTPSIRNLGEGQYCVTVTDYNGCQGSDCINVEKSKDVLQINVASRSDVQCNGGSDGYALVSASGGSGSYTYGWPNGDKTPSSYGLAAGSYLVEASDENGCHGSASVTINEPPKLTVIIYATQIFVPYCSDKKPPDVTLTVTATGGTPYYFYSWPGGSITVHSTGIYSCTVHDQNNCTARGEIFILFIPIDCPKDPNILKGLIGFGEEQWVSVNDKLTYTVFYENDPNLATAPAQEVRIKVPLTEKVDPYSLRVGNFGFGNFDFTIPPGASFYQKRLDVRDSLGVYVDVTAGLDVVHSEAFWIMQSIDPLTGLPPNNPQTGFLPINDSITRRGEGYVTFTCKPKQSDQTGDTIHTAAGIIFDVNEPISTNTWFNTVDAFPPSSIVSPLPAAMDTTTFSISFIGNDDPGGCGISKYKLWYSQDSAPFTLWGECEAGSTVEFTGQKNSTYGFFSLATDHVGNTEAMKTVADVVTSIPGVCTIIPAIVPVSCYSYGNGAISLAVSGGITPFTYTWSNGATTKDLSALMAGIYHVTITDGLSRQSTLSCLVNEPPAWSVGIAGPSGVCPGETGYRYSIVLTDPAYPGALYASQWSVAGGNITAGQHTDTVTVTWLPGTQGTVGLSLTRTVDGCSLSKTSGIIINPSLTLTNSITTPETTVCSGTPVTITCNHNYPVSGYDWHVNGMIVSHNPVLIYVPADGDEVSCTCRVAFGGCWSEPSAVSNTITMNLYPVPPATQTFTGITVVSQQSVCYSATQTIIVGGTGSFLVENSGAVNLIAGQNIRMLPGTKVELGAYLHGFISNNCLWCNALPTNQKFATEPVQPGTTTATVNLPENQTHNLFRVYPNPTTGAFTLELSGVTEKSIVKVEIYGMYGEKLMNARFTGAKKHEFTLEGKPTGIYFIRVSCGDILGSQKIIKH